MHIHPTGKTKGTQNQVRDRFPRGFAEFYRSKRLIEELRQQIAVLEAKLRSLSVCSFCARSLQQQPDRPSPLRDTVKRDTKEEDSDELVESFRQVTIEGIKSKFYGSASPYALLSNAIEEKYLGRPPPTVTSYSRRRLYWELLPVSRYARPRERYDQHYVYPASDLIDSLLELYFVNVHPIFPCLHRPSFERAVAEGLHLKDTRFGATLLAVLAIAARYSDDHRVFVDGETSLSSGWKFVVQVEIFGKCVEPTIHDVEFCFVIYLVCSTMHNAARRSHYRYMQGLGIRWLQHHEYHRKRAGHEFEDELWNRVFWCFFIIDRMVSAFVGRPPTMRMEDYDLEPLLEVDDEYWEQGFMQPPGVPSLLSYFACFIRLSELLGDTQRLYAPKKRKIRMGWTGSDWEQGTVAELDSAMNDFFDSIPAHLRRDPNGRGVFLDQSVTLHAMYYHIQIMIHRPYIRSQSPLAEPSLSICLRAARSTLYILNIWMDRLINRLPFPWVQNFAFTSAVVLLLNIFGSKRAGLPMDPVKDLALVATALEILKVAEQRSHTAGRLGDLLHELQSSLDGPAPGHEVNLGAGGLSEPSMVFGDLGNAPSTDFSGTTMNEVYAPQHGQSFEPGMSIEQLLAATDPAWDDSGDVSSGTLLDNEFMSSWMAAPTNFM
ncbi:fungal-specific transcription factor domain-containing protein [Mycena maculata]|uniref:Fungal-specific transcription factor domain-containing protein n=1 Tax=Mycena maculata TaxID=230809 RepID=A0AAD7JVN7_9AGAR|nr:fungal-specific transcription factor domain-containing protein [Mycena maculata]